MPCRRSGRPIYTLREAADRLGRARRGARYSLACARAERRRYGPAGVQPGRHRWPGVLGRAEVGRRRGLDADVAAGARRVDGPARRGRIDRDPPWAARHPDGTQRRRADHGAGVSRRRRVHSAPGGAHRRGVPASHGQRPHLFRGRRPRHLGERDLRHRIRRPDGLHSADPAAHPDRVVGAARRVRGARSATWCSQTAAGWSSSSATR